jgi:phosphate-selective porin
MSFDHSGGARRRNGAAGVLISLLAWATLPAWGQAQQSADDEAATSVNADENGPEEATRRMVHWNEYEGRWFTARLGGGFLYDSANYSQDADSKSQLELDPEMYVRDSRLLLKGRLKFSPRLSYTIGYMYDPAPEKRTWFWRQTGIYVDMPEWGGDLFIGRTKEGISMNKIMVGYNGWTNERATSNDAFIPILADGIQLRGSLPEHGIAWNFGAYADDFSESESFNKNDNQYVARGVWQPWHGKTGDILHLGLAYRYAVQVAPRVVLGTLRDRHGRIRSQPHGNDRRRDLLPARLAVPRRRVFPEPERSAAVGRPYLPWR